jgi:hypothetical protein
MFSVEAPTKRFGRITRFHERDKLVPVLATASQCLPWCVSGLTITQMGDFIRRFVQRLLQKPAVHAFADDASADNLLADDGEAYTVFEGTALRLRELTLESPAEMAEDVGSRPPGAFCIRLAESQSSRKGAGTLMSRRYAFRGYQVKNLEVDPNLVTFIAYDAGHLVGTVGVRFDSAKGLAAEQLYRTELDQLRQNGARICEFTRLAVDVRIGSKPVLAALFHTAYLLAYRLRKHDAAVIEVNPRHVAFYRRALAFEPLGPERLSPRVNAPAVLLTVPFSRIEAELAKHVVSGPVGKSTHSLFAYGFSALEEEGILGRLHAFPFTGQDRPHALG